MKKRQKDVAAIITTGGGTPTPEQVAAINRFALEPHEASQLYVRPVYLCHNAIDRDNDRFDEALLADFVRTLPGKALLLGHDHKDPAAIVGAFFSAELVEESLEAAISRTGEDLRLPEGASSVKWVKGWLYLPLTDEDCAEIVPKINAGVLRHVSIGFDADGPVPQRGADDEIIFWEWKPPGEAQEGSLVWLGAQPGATTSAKEVKEHKDHERKEPTMKGIMKALGLSPDANEESGVKAVSELTAKAAKAEADLTAAKALLEKAGIADEATAKDLAEDAATGKTYRDTLAKEAAAFARMVGRVDVGGEEAFAKTLAARPLADLKAEHDFYEKAAKEKHPGGTGKVGGSSGGTDITRGAPGEHALVAAGKSLWGTQGKK
jgi:hypothetical protein